MIYLLVKAVHITAVIAWASGMAMLVVTMVNLSRTASVIEPDERRWLVVVQRWDRLVTSPALLVLWSCGLTLAVSGGWLGAPWLWCKLVLAVALSGLHGVLAGMLRRSLSDGRRIVPRRAGAMAGAAAGALGVVVLLATLKL